jgi:hypothetical protein
VGVGGAKRDLQFYSVFPKNVSVFAENVLKFDYPNKKKNRKKKNNNNKVKSIPLELYELAGKTLLPNTCRCLSSISTNCLQRVVFLRFWKTDGHGVIGH